MAPSVEFKTLLQLISKSDLFAVIRPFQFGLHRLFAKSDTHFGFIACAKVSKFLKLAKVSPKIYNFSALIPSCSCGQSHFAPPDCPLFPGGSQHSGAIRPRGCPRPVVDSGCRASPDGAGSGVPQPIFRCLEPEWRLLACGCRGWCGLLESTCRLFQYFLQHHLVVVAVGPP